ncbi:adenine-specific methyltransferase EcoRI family protein [Schleiferilactobacillus harbinensis]|uniref:adenine-specific methyltransferase EcoRI family protein n=1 Tax=Schleiferilactobacillus harbinensis TaxID=304207 RepID=UPI001AAEA946|nr:adenine-specific methyltransferase EcoRI family protein [Schleiferilactobacillus harbinensis]MBO3093166.1 adenine-specific methyltransferase EcoRI family protein [Schleiferilactobacillus harbinensis]
MPGTRALNQAKKAKNDEFYTQWVDIEKEMNAYVEYNPDVFRNKTILLPCDDPFESNFFKFFATHFNDYGLKRLISTSYDPSPIVNTQLELSLFDDDTPVKPGTTKKISRAYRIDLTDVSDFDKDGRINITDVEQFLLFERKRLSRGERSSVIAYLQGDSNPDGIHRFSAGDFRSKEVTKLRDQADIIITNPPFSLFREFLVWINPSEKLFSIIGNVNAITYKSVFPLIMSNNIWLGESIHSGDREFMVPKTYPLKASGYRIDKGGNKYIRVKGVRWFTNINHGRRHQPLSLMTMADNIKFSKHKQVRGHEYAHYDNYDAIEVPFTDAIPSDYDGVMGVPITFLDKYNPDQFEIVAFRKGEDGKDLVYSVHTHTHTHTPYFRVLVKYKYPRTH